MSERPGGLSEPYVGTSPGDPMEVKVEKATSMYIGRCQTELRALSDIFCAADIDAGLVQDRLHDVGLKLVDLAARMSADGQALFDGKIILEPNGE